MQLGATSCQAGWPTHLALSNGDRFVRLRDGHPGSVSGSCNGEPALFGKIDGAGFVMRDLQYIAFLPAGLPDVPCDPIMTGNPWLSDSAMAATGQSPIVIPPEPVQWPA